MTDTDGWIEWVGGECPVPPETLVEVRSEFDDIVVGPEPASMFNWGGSAAWLIVAYRVVTPAASPEHKGELSALIASIRAGLEGVTPGPWAVASDLPAYAIMAVDANGRGGHRVVQTPNQNNYRRFGPSETWNGIQSVANAAHIARLSPDNVLRLLDELDAREARALAAEKERDELKTDVRLAFEEGRISTHGADKNSFERAWNNSRARQSIKGKTP